MTIYHNISGIHASELYVDGWMGLGMGSLCGVTIRASLRDANKGAQDPGLRITKCVQNGLNRFFTQFQLYSQM